MPEAQISTAFNIGPFTLEAQEFFKHVLIHCHSEKINSIIQGIFLLTMEICRQQQYYLLLTKCDNTIATDPVSLLRSGQACVLKLH